MAKTSLHAFKAKDTRFVTDWLKSKGLRKLCSVFEGIQDHLYYLWHVRVLSIKPCLHTQLPEHNKSYRKVSRGWGHLITWSGPMMGHLNSFSASGGGNLNKDFPNIQMRGCLPGGGGMLKLRFNWYITGSYTEGQPCPCNVCSQYWRRIFEQFSCPYAVFFAFPLTEC